MPLDPELSYLHCVVMEIIETERIYVHDLHSIVEGYLTHIIDNAGLPIIPEQVCSLFGNIEDIYEFNSELLQELDLCNNDPVAIGRCFVLKSDYFEIYTQYCTNYPNSVAALTECMRNKTLLKFFMDRQEALKHPLPLGSYLLKPVQRILKYHLLLQEIAKHFDPDEEGYEVVEEAINTMTEVAWYINTMKRKHEHAVRLQEVQSLLVDWRGPDLTTYGELVLEGTFRFHHAKNNRTLFLLERVLLITKRRGENFIYKTHISCSTLMLMEGTKDSLCFSVTHYKHPKQPHTVQAKTMEEKKLWTHHIKRLIIENYHTIIPQKAKQVILEMDPVHEKYRFNSEKKKKSQSNDFTHTHQSAAAGPKDEEWHGHRHIRPSQQVEVQDRPNTKKTSPHILQFKNSTEVRPAQEIKPESDFEGVQIRHGEDDVSIMERSARGEVRDDSIQNQDGPSSEEETEENCAGSKDHSIQSSSVLHKASAIAEHFIVNAHRSGAAPDDFIVNVYCSGAAPDELQSPRRIQLGVTSNKNLTPQFPRETVSESGRRVCRRGDSSLSKREQLLIGKVRNYYEKAEQLDEGFGLRRRESLTYIPRGLVHTSVSHFNQIPHTKPPNTQTLLVTSSTTSHISTSVDRVRDELGSEGTDSKSRTSEEFRSSAEMIRVWQEMEKKFTSSPRETRLRNASQFKGTGSVLQRFSTNGDEGDAKCIEDLSSITEEPTVQAKGDEDDSGGNSVLIIKKKFCEHTHVKETPARRQHSETSIDTTLQINPPSVLHEKKTLRGSPKLASCDQTHTPSSSCSPLPILPTQHSQYKSTAPTEGFSWPDVSELRSIYTSLEFSRLNSAVKTLAPGCGAQNKSAVQRSDCLNQNRAGLVWTEVQNKKWSSNYIISAQTALPNNTTISVLEKVNNTPLEASQHHVPVQSLSPWENLLSVTDRCRAYEHPDKLAFRAQPQPKDNNNKTDKHLETTQQQGVVRNLREKFLNPT